MIDLKDLIKVAKHIVEDHLKQKGVPETPEAIVTMIAVVVVSIKQVYAVDWPKALDFFDRMCFQYAGNVSAVQALKMIDDTAQKQEEEFRNNNPDFSGTNIIDFASRLKKENLN